MISPDDIRLKALRRYTEYLQSLMRGEPFEPIEIKGVNAYTKTSLAEFQREMRLLMGASKEQCGYGYTIRYQRVKTRYLGEQELPVGIYFASAADYERFLGKETEVAVWRDWSERLSAEFAELRDWVLANPMKVVQYAAEWESILAVCRYFRANPRPGLYVRQLPVPVPTKFVERHQAILRELLDMMLGEQVDRAEKQFERRYGLRYSESLVRFRLLDAGLRRRYFSGVEDMAVPVTTFERLALPVERVLVVENKTSLYTALSLPDMPGTMVIFGGGYGVQSLRGAEWLDSVSDLWYWGDLDAHGFEILSQCRQYFPRVESVLMDAETFRTYFEGDAGVVVAEKSGLLLTEAERALYELLVRNNWRLEQEKIPQDYVEGYFGSRIG